MKSSYLNIITHAFPQHLRTDVTEAFQVIPLASNFKFNLISTHFHEVFVKGELLKIPVRIYFKEPQKTCEKQLTERQKTLLNCLYTRHHDGYIREERLKKLTHKPKDWEIPFIIQLLSEYLYELFPTIDAKVNEETIPLFHQFKKENPIFWQQTHSRIASYWGKYYRSTYPDFKTYLGYEIFNRINKTH